MGVGVESDKINHNDHFVIGTIRNKWNSFLRKKNQNHKTYLPLINLWFRDARKIRHGINTCLSDVLPTQRLKKVTLAADYCASCVRNNVKPNFKQMQAGMADKMHLKKGKSIDALLTEFEEPDSKETFPVSGQELAQKTPRPGMAEKMHLKKGMSIDALLTEFEEPDSKETFPVSAQEVDQKTPRQLLIKPKQLLFNSNNLKLTPYVAEFAEDDYKGQPKNKAESASDTWAELLEEEPTRFVKDSF